MSSQFTLQYNMFIQFNQQKLHSFLLKSVTPNLIACFVLFKIVLPSILLITPCVTLTKHETAWSLKFSAPFILTSPVVIIARYDAILDQ